MAGVRGVVAIVLSREGRLIEIDEGSHCFSMRRGVEMGANGGWVDIPNGVEHFTVVSGALTVGGVTHLPGNMFELRSGDRNETFEAKGGPARYFASSDDRTAMAA